MIRFEILRRAQSSVTRSGEGTCETAFIEARAVQPLGVPEAPRGTSFVIRMKGAL